MFMLDCLMSTMHEGRFYEASILALAWVLKMSSMFGCCQDYRTILGQPRSILKANQSLHAGEIRSLDLSKL
jgi:hypothetical protein